MSTTEIYRFKIRANSVFILEGFKMAMNGNYFWYKGDHYVQTKGVAMRARCDPSVANLSMNKWEEEQIYSVDRPSLKFYR